MVLPSPGGGAGDQDHLDPIGLDAVLQRRGDEVVGLGGHGCRLGDGGGLRGGAHRLEVGHHAEQRGAEQGAAS